MHSMEQNRVISQTFRWKAVRSSGLLASHEILTISWAIETYDLVGTMMNYAQEIACKKNNYTIVSRMY